MTRMRRATKFARDHQPHIYGAGAVLSGLAAAGGIAAGAAQFREEFGFVITAVIVGAVFACAFVGSLLLRGRK